MWSRNASQPEPASQLRGRSHRVGRDRAPRRSSATRTRRAQATPARRRTTCSDTASPRRPPSRKRNALSGETTYGGFATTRSNCSPSTGSKKLPSRVSTLPTPLSAMLKSAYASARALTSVATTLFACAARRIAWMPLPVQEVERTLAGAAHGHVRKRDRRPVHARHVVGVPPRRRSDRRRSAARREERCARRRERRHPRRRASRLCASSLEAPRRRAHRDGRVRRERRAGRAG